PVRTISGGRRSRRLCHLSPPLVIRVARAIHLCCKDAVALCQEVHSALEDSMTRSLSRWLYPPLMLVGFNAAAIALIAGGRSHLLLAPLLAAAVAVSFAAERLIPYNAAWNDGYDDRARDVAH